MVFYSAGFGLLLHFFFWGAGFALLITPRRWRAGWPALCAPAGIALQSAVVWIGAMSGVPGAQVYGYASLSVPLVLLGAGLWRAYGVQHRRVFLELAQWRGVFLLMAAVLAALLLPFAVASKVLTSSSLGSCDAADYAAGARVLLEFARSDRSGFIGLTEVVQLHSVDNFFDHWLRLNHFTPSALIALNAAIFSYQPYEIVSVITAVFLVLSLPTVYWLARATFRYGRAASGWLTAVYGASPLLWYAVYHVATSQLLAALAIALVNGTALQLWREGAAWRLGWAWSGVLALAFWIILGAYNFIVVVCLIPAAAFVGMMTLYRNDWAKLGRWLALVLAPLLAVAGIFTGRTLGLVERFLLFQQYDFGWKIPALSPEGWLGLVGSTSLHAYPVSLRVTLALVVAGLWIVGWVRGFRSSSMNTWIAVWATLPILLGYGFLEIRAVLHGTNASYDAYKLLCVFYPGLLAGMAYWVTLFRDRSMVLRWVSIGGAVVVLGWNAWAGQRFMKRMQSPPLLVDPALAHLQKIETMPEVQSLNLLIGDFWGRLWANSFLLRKPQYFPTYTYEGRRNTELKGEWDLLGGVITVRLPESRAELRLKPPYSLLDTKSPYYLHVATNDGWYEPEVIAKAASHWRWTKGNASLLVDNPHPQALRATLRCSFRSLVNRDLQVFVNGEHVRSGALGTQQRTLRIPGLVLPPGRSIIEFRSSVPPVSPGPNDERLLGFAVYELDLIVLRDGQATEP